MKPIDQTPLEQVAWFLRFPTNPAAPRLYPYGIARVPETVPKNTQSEIETPKQIKLLGGGKNNLKQWNN